MDRNTLFTIFGVIIGGYALIYSIRCILFPERIVEATKRRIEKQKWILLLPFAEVVNKDWYPRYLRVNGILIFVFVLFWFWGFFQVISK